MNIDLFSPETSVWEFTRKRSLLTILKIVAALLAFPGTFLALFTILWTLGLLIGHIPVVVAFACPLLLCFCVTLCKLFYDGYSGDEGVSFQRPVLENLIPVVSFIITSFFAYVVAALSLLDGDAHTLAEWYYFFYLGSSPVGALSSHSPIGLSGFSAQLVAWGLFSLLYVTVYPSVTIFTIHALFRCKERRAGTQMEL
jgi:hypothetical protein